MYGSRYSLFRCVCFHCGDCEQDKRWVQQCHVLQRLDHCWFPQRRLEMMEPKKPLVRDWKALWVTVKLIKKNRQVRSAFWPPANASLPSLNCQESVIGTALFDQSISLKQSVDTVSSFRRKWISEVLLSLPISAKPLLPFSSIYKHSQLPHEEEHKMCLDMVWVLIWDFPSFLHYSFFLIECVTFFCSIIGKSSRRP